MLVKLKCVEGFYWNLTKPYLMFETDKYYLFTVSENCYLSIDCDYIQPIISEDKFFMSMEDIREEKLNELGI